MCVQNPSLYQHSLSSGLSSMSLQEDPCRPAKIRKVDTYQVLKNPYPYHESVFDGRSKNFQKHHVPEQQFTLPSLKRYVK